MTFTPELIKTIKHSLLLYDEESWPRLAALVKNLKPFSEKEMEILEKNLQRKYNKILPEELRFYLTNISRVIYISLEPFVITHDPTVLHNRYLLLFNDYSWNVTIDLTNGYMTFITNNLDNIEEINDSSETLSEHIQKTLKLNPSHYIVHISGSLGDMTKIYKIDDNYNIDTKIVDGHHKESDIEMVWNLPRSVYNPWYSKISRKNPFG